MTFKRKKEIQMQQIFLAKVNFKQQIRQLHLSNYFKSLILYIVAYPESVLPFGCWLGWKD